MVIDISFISMWLLLPLIWHYMLKMAELSLLTITIPSIVMVSIYVYQYIGLPVLYFQLNDYRAEFVTNKYLMLEVFFYTSWTITFMLLGYIIANFHFGKLSWKKCCAWSDRCVDNKRALFRLQRVLFFLVVISILVLARYLFKVGFDNIALVVALDLGANDLSIGSARSSMGNAFDGKYHWYKLFIVDLLQFYLFILFSMYLIKKRITNRFMLVITLLAVTLATVMATEKGPMANLIIALFFIYIIIKFHGDIPFKGLILISSFLLVILAIFYLYFMNVKTLLDGINSVFSRVFTGQIQPAYHYLNYFQTNHDFLLGTSFPNPGGIFPFETFNLTKEIMAWHNPSQVELGVVGSMPTIFWGEMYANFGLLGVLIPPFFVGYSLYLLNFVIFKLEYSPLTIGVFVWLIMHFMILSVTGLSSFFLDIYLYGILLTFILLSLYIGRGKIILYSRRSKRDV